MNDLETQLHDTLHSLAEDGRSQSGPALRRRARTRSLAVRSGGLAAIGATGAVAVLVVPGLLSGGLAASGQAGASTSKAAGLKPTPAGHTGDSSQVPVQANVWNPSGALVYDPAVDAAAPKAAGDWGTMTGMPQLEADTVAVVYGDRVTLDTSGPAYPRPLVIVTGRTSASDPTLRITALTTIAGGVDSRQLGALTSFASRALPKDGPQAIAAFNTEGGFVAADGGITSAEYTYTDATGTHTEAMTLEKGVATTLLNNAPAATVNPSQAPTSVASVPDALPPVQPRLVTRVVAKSGNTVVWDGPPINSR